MKLEAPEESRTGSPLPAELSQLCQRRKWGSAIREIAGLRKSQPALAAELVRAVFDHARASGPGGAEVIAAIRYSPSTGWTRDLV